MFIGHLAVGFASKRLAPRSNLGILLAAPLLLDLLWPAFLVTGLESVRIAPGDTAFTPLRFVAYPITHSLAGCFLWAAAFAGIYLSVTSYLRGTVVVFGGVMSHWVLDAITHRPDLPVLPAGPFVGFGLWNWPLATVLAEGAMFAASLWIYTRYTRARNITGKVALAGLVAFLILVYAGIVFGPPPPGEMAVAAGAFATWLFPLWGAWVERHRRLSLAGATGARAALQIP
ncbi:MAG: hypothetical protein SFV51_29625 [Bryobacteraceae bacterium]|nr:hypothetical protein [Bryobacteraceae bacterium]